VDPEERTLQEREQQSRQPVHEEVSFRPLDFWGSETQLYEEQVEQHACRQADLYVSTFAEEQDSHGHFKGRKQQGEECDVGHDHPGPQFAGGKEKGRPAERFVNVIVGQSKFDVDEAS
jgi:hypothetical protein